MSCDTVYQTLMRPGTGLYQSILVLAEGEEDDEEEEEEEEQEEEEEEEVNAEAVDTVNDRVGSSRVKKPWRDRTH